MEKTKEYYIELLQRVAEKRGQTSEKIGFFKR